MVIACTFPRLQKLEEQNPQFFQAYYTRLKLKDQIVLFNHLLDQQVSIVQRYQWNRIPPQVTGVSTLASQQPGMPTAPGLPVISAELAAAGAAAPPTEPGAAEGAFNGSVLQAPDLALDDVQVSTLGVFLLPRLRKQKRAMRAENMLLLAS